MLNRPSRRQLLAGSLSTAGLLAAGRFPLQAQQRAPANQRLNVAVVGLGTRGTHLLREFLAEGAVQVVALCDVHDSHYRDLPWGRGPNLGLEPAVKMVEQHYAEERKSGSYRGCDSSADYRPLLDQYDLDALVVATPDHWHAKITLDAIARGIDVYCEKPVTHFFAEGQQICKAADRHKTVFQVGSQQRSDPLFRRAVELVRNGHLGAIRRVEVGLPAGYATCNDTTAPSPPPAGLDYEWWCGPAPRLPYARAWHHRWWRAVSAYGGGVLMDWIGHHLDIAHWGLAQSLAGPLRVHATRWTASACTAYDTPADYTIECEYPGKVEVVIASNLTQGAKWIGEDGWVWVNRGQLEVSDPRWLESDMSLGDWRLEPSPGHVSNFVQCVASRQPCEAPAEVGHRSITPGHLAYVSHRVGRPLQWDPFNEQIIDDMEADELLRRAPYRAPWSLNVDGSQIAR